MKLLVAPWAEEAEKEDEEVKTKKKKKEKNKYKQLKEVQVKSLYRKTLSPGQNLRSYYSKFIILED